MPGAYSTDLRERVLVAVEAGEPADAVADEFMVGRSSVYRWIAAARDEGRRVAKPMGHGPKPLIRDETVRWSPWLGQFGGLAKLGSDCCQAANVSVPVAQYASLGVRPASVECGRRAL